MKLFSKLKAWLISLYVFLITILAQTPTFASMGSSGGGGGGSGGSSGGSGDGDGSYAATGPLPLVLLIWACLWLSSLLNFLFDMTKYHLMFTWMTPNMRVEQIEDMIERARLQNKSIPKLVREQLGELYAKAQFVYSSDIRNLYTGNRTRAVKPMLGSKLWETMNDEIHLKASHNSFDDVVVSYTQITKSYQLNPSVWLVKLTAFGFDNEYNIEAGFDSTFKREQWTDYVLFGWDGKSDNWKILNIVYGSHFHLNGHDFNEQADLTADGLSAELVNRFPTGYTEHSVEDLPGWHDRINKRNWLSAFKLRYTLGNWIVTIVGALWLFWFFICDAPVLPGAHWIKSVDEQMKNWWMNKL